MANAYEGLLEIFDVSLHTIGGPSQSRSPFKDETRPCLVLGTSEPRLMLPWGETKATRQTQKHYAIHFGQDAISCER